MRCSRSGSSCSARACSQRPAGLVARPRRSASASRPTATWFLRTVSTRVQRRFRDKVTIALESHVARLQASVATIAHQERPEYLDRLAVLRDQVFVLDHMYMSVFSTCGWILRLGVTRRAARVDPPGARAARRVRAADRAHLDVAAGGRARGRRSAARRPSRLARHLFATATTAPPGKEVRVTGIGERLVDGAARGVGALVRAGGAPRAGARRSGTRWPGRSSARATSARSCSCRRACARRPATSCSCSPPARGCRRTSAPPSARSASCAASGWTARGGSPGSRTTRRRSSAAADRPVPGALARGHPPRARLVRLSRHRRASCSTTSTLDAAGGRGRRHRRRERRGQDHARQAARQAVRADGGRDPRRRRAARAHARRRVARRGSPARSRTSSASSSARATRSASATCRASTTSRRSSPPSGGPAPTTSSRGCRRASRRSSARPGPAASRSSFGQWQKLALARGFMRDRPLLLVLDEPTAALDAETEHALFERYAAAARGADGEDDGRITILVSHRFSHRAHGRPHRRARRRPRRRGRHARGADGEAAASTPSSTASRRPRTSRACPTCSSSSPCGRRPSPPC